MHLLLRILLAAAAGSWLPVMAHCQDIIDSTTHVQVFAPGVVSSTHDEWATSFSPDNKTVYFSRGSVYWTICYAQNQGGVWTRPAVASFSGQWNDTDPFISPDGSRIFFISNRPLEGAAQDKPNPHFYIWYAEHGQGDQWGTPHPVGGGVNIDSGDNFASSVSAKGTLFWCSRDRQGNKGMQGYYSVRRGDHYDQPAMLRIAGVTEVQDPFIAADEQYLVFLSGSDIYISYRKGDGWSAAQKLGAKVNTGDGNSSPYVSHDGKMLYFASWRVKGFYQRDRSHAVDYDALEKENEGLFNGLGNIFMIPVHLPSSIQTGA